MFKCFGNTSSFKTGSGSLVDSDQEKDGMLNKCFSSAFTYEDSSDTPD